MEINEELNEKENFFFDLDKTIWNWDSMVIGAEDLIHNLKRSGKNIYYHTDNTLLSREGYANKITSLGVSADKDEVFTVGYALGKHLSENMVNKAYVMGESGLIEDLEEAGIEVTDDAETVIIGFDRQFNYRKIRRAFEILEEGGRLYICSTEKRFTTSANEIPHQGVLNQVFGGFENVEVAGKPGDIFLEQFRDYFDFESHNSIFIGDRLADMETGNKLGMTTGAVMSGTVNKSKLADAEDIQEPDFGIPSLHRLRRRIL